MFLLLTSVSPCNILQISQLGGTSVLLGRCCLDVLYTSFLTIWTFFFSSDINVRELTILPMCLLGITVPS